MGDWGWLLVAVSTFLAVLCIVMWTAGGSIRDLWPRADGMKTVRWIGGPFDGQTFKVERSRTTINVGSTWFDVDLDVGGPQVQARRMMQWPIERSLWRHYVVWRDGDESG